MNRAQKAAEFAAEFATRLRKVMQSLRSIDSKNPASMKRPSDDVDDVCKAADALVKLLAHGEQRSPRCSRFQRWRSVRASGLSSVSFLTPRP